MNKLEKKITLNNKNTKKKSIVMIVIFCIAFIVSAQQPTKISIESVSQIPNDSIISNDVITLKNISIGLAPKDSIIMSENGTPLTKIEIKAISQISRDSMINLYKKIGLPVPPIDEF